MIDDVQHEIQTWSRRIWDGSRVEDYTFPARRSPSQWATQVRRIAAGTATTTSVEIAYDHAFMPHCVEPMDALDNPSIKTLVLWGPRRGGKTNSVCMNAIGRTVTDDPLNIYSVHPIDPDVQRFSEGDVEPTIEACLTGYFVDKKSRDSGRTIYFKKFKGGWLRIVPAGSLTQFRGTNVGLMLLHELDALSAEAIAMAEGRTTGIPGAKIIKEGTGTIDSEINNEGKEVYHSNIKQAYDLGTKKQWFCACRECGVLQTLEYEQITYPPGQMELARYRCRVCSFPHHPYQFRQIIAKGRWLPTAGLTSEQIKDIASHYAKARAIDSSVDSYHWNGFNSLLPHSTAYKSKLHEFVAEGEAAKRSPAALKIWTQEVAAKLWSPNTEGEAPPDWKKIYARRENYGLSINKRGLWLSAFADVQKNRIEVDWRAWGRREESWGMDHVVIDGYYGAQETWDDLRRELRRKWQHESGATMRLGFAHIDCGKWGGEIGLRFFRKLKASEDEGVYGHVRASKGIGKHGHPVIITGTKNGMMNVNGDLKGSHIGTWAAKDILYDRFRMEIGEDGVIPEGYMRFNERYSEAYHEQMMVERVNIVYVNGEEERRYKNPDNHRNEALDLIVGNFATFRMRINRNWDALEAEIMENAAIARGEKMEVKKEEPMIVSLGGMRF